MVKLKNNSALDTMFPLLLAALLLRTKLVFASTVLRNQEVPTTESLAGCRTSCGDLTFSYPFGIGPGCFRWPDFELICNDSVQPPRLFFPDGITQVTYNIVTADTGNFYYRSNTYVGISFTSIIPVRFGVDNYSMSWEPPGKSFELPYLQLNVTGCDFAIYIIDRMTNSTALWPCQLTCPTTEITDAKARQDCNGTGCCPVLLYNNALDLKFVRHKKVNIEAPHNRSLLWHYINVTTTYGALRWKIFDQPSCARAMENNITFACAKGSRCVDYGGYWFINSGYYCRCNSGYMGNPYILQGCSRDKGYNKAAQQKSGCSRKCGNIKVPFPFGVEEGCSGRKQFYLNCTNVTTSSLLLGNYYLVTDIDLDEGLIKYIVPDKGERSIEPMSIDDPGIFIDSDRSVSLEWVVANLSCPEAKANSSGYACGGNNSNCIPVNSTDGYAGYRCQCTYGFEGNPYNQSGCQDIDECRMEPTKCNGAVCRNTIGSYSCIECPQKTVYDPTKNQCSPVKRQKNVLTGIVIGLSSGFSALLVSLSGVYLTRRWKRNIQERLRRMYFRRNKGLLLEQLIVSDENASENTKIFSLEELEKATNNFDPTRILGRGGHGMVYKGILSDQRVVAIKRSKISEEGEINQFINEVAVLSQINHRNIVRLFGCCLETEVPLLVYDFIPNGSLYEILHGDSNSGLVLSWDACLRIAAEAAGALYYLHSAASVSVFHRDVKSSNILLDSNYTAKVSDFGSSRLVPVDQTHVVTNVQGTFGYLDPEYYHTGQLNEKSDVYSFGVVLLELLVRKKPIITSESGEKQNLGNYFLWERKAVPITAIVDTQVLEEASEEEINCVATLAEMCLRLQGDKRPTMKQVEVALQFLRTKRAELNVAANGKDEERQTLHARIEIDFGKRPQTASPEHSHRFYSLEEEFLSNAGLPR